MTASYDWTARLWSTGGELLQVLRGHRAPVCRAVFAADGARVLTASMDASARTWLLDPQRMDALAASRALRDFEPAERRELAPLLRR